MLLRLTTSLFCAWLTYRGIRYFVVRNPLDLIPGPKPKSWVEGNIGEVIDPDAWAFHSLLEKYGPISMIKGFFGTHMVNVFDPKALYHILVKEQDVFEENPIFRITFGIVFGQGLLSTLGDHHRKQRKLLNPAFSQSHIRELVPVFYSVVYKLRDAMRNQVIRGDKEIDVFSWSTRTALEVIGQSGLGYSFDPLTDDAEEHPFSSAIRGFAQLLNTFTISRFVLLPLVYDLGPARFRRFVVDMLPWPKLHRLRDVVDVMHDTCVEIFETKKRSLERGEPPITGNPWDGKDIISILLKANMSASESERLPDSELLAQLTTLIFAAMDTTSNSTARIFHLLAQHQDIQQRLREEIIAARSRRGELQYDELDHLPYLDAVCKESLRLYPVLPFMVRYSNRDTILPLWNPVKLNNGEKSDKLHIPKGSDILIGILGCNRNPDIWGPDADEWKPERWLKPLPSPVLDSGIPGIYAHLMTFIGGGRSCPGFKFAILEMKVILSVLLEEFAFELSDKEVMWQINGVVQPAVKDPGASKDTPPRIQLPMKVSLVRS